MNDGQAVREAIRRGTLNEQNVTRPALTKNAMDGINRVVSANKTDGTASQNPAAGPAERPGTAFVPTQVTITGPTRVTSTGSMQTQAVKRETGPGTNERAQASQPQAHSLKDMKTPVLQNPVRKGQKTALNLEQSGCTRLRVCFGWNIRDSRCDVDASAFPITQGERVISDDWFVFYGQPDSPDGSICFRGEGGEDREYILVDFRKLDPRITKIVFVVTINEALENHLHFGMLKDVYIRVMNADTGREIVSYQPEEYYNSVTSMTMAEIYLHNGAWKINPVGSGVARDLAGQCAIYGVEIC